MPSTLSRERAVAKSAPESDRFWLAATFVLIVGIAARQLLLGPAPFHPDEAIHAFFAQGFGGYHYDPVYHGPLLYHLVAGVFGIVGKFAGNDGAYDFTARLVPSLLGIGLLGLILFPMRRFVGNRAALAGAALVAISPSIVTYSRHLLHDSLVLFLTLGAVLCFAWTLQYPSDSREGRSVRIGLAAFLTLFLATKANFFFIAVMLLAFWIARRASGWLRLPDVAERWLPALCFVVVTAFAIAFPRDNTSAPALQLSQHRVFQIVAVLACGALWFWLMARRQTNAAPTEKSERVRSTLPKAPPIASATAKTSKKVGAKVARVQPTEVAVTPVKSAQSSDKNAALLTYILVAATALWLYVFLFGNGAQILGQWAATGSFPAATFAEGRQSALTAIPRMLKYWGGQQGTPRLPGRHDYYVVLALLYEVPILIAAAGGVWHAARNRSTFTDLLLWWAFTSWAVYAVANEKVPWLLVHVCLPLALLGGVWLGQLKLSKPVWVLGLTLGAFFSLRTDYAMIFQRAGDNAEPILYAQTPDAFRDVAEVMLADTRGDVRPIWMHNERQWPSVWYFRRGGPDVGSSGISLGSTINPDATRAGVSTVEDLASVAAMKRAGWHTKTVNFLIWPRASWAALEPQRYWKWFWTRDTFPLTERGLPQTQWKTSILAGNGEWSNAEAVVGWHKN